MNKLLAALILTLPLIATSAFAAEPPPPAKPSAMGACAKENKGLKGAEFKAAQKACMAKGAQARAAQREKTKTCRTEAKAKPLADRKAYIKACVAK